MSISSNKQKVIDVDDLIYKKIISGESLQKCEISNLKIDNKVIDIDLDFSGAIFKNELIIENVEFLGKVDFSGADFQCPVIFDSVIFKQEVTFEGCMFKNMTAFGGLKCLEDISYEGVKFSQIANFIGSTFIGLANFSYTEFSKYSIITKNKFEEQVNFQNAKFEEKCVFDDNQFINGSIFSEVDFCDECSFARTEFKGDTRFIKSIFKGKSIFTNAVFLNETNFFQSEFFSEARFNSTKYSGITNFDNVRFLGRAVFGSAEFSNDTSFAKAAFGSETYFGYVKFSKLSFNYARFLDRVFFDGKPEDKIFSIDKETNFISVLFEKPEKVLFRGVNFKKCKLLNTDLSQVELTDIDWSVKKGLLKSRRVVYDELVLNDADNTEYIEKVYRQLKKNYENRGSYGEAGDFHYGEMEMKRKSYNKYFRLFSFASFYKFFSGYGENTWLTILWLIIFVFIIPSVYLHTGMENKVLIEGKYVINKVIDYNFSPSLYFLSNKEFWSDYYDSFVHGLEVITLKREKLFETNSATGRLFDSVQILLFTIELTLCILTLKRKFKR